MISAVAVAQPVKAAAGLASVVVAAAVGGGETAVYVDVATNARHSQIMLILLTLTRISPQMRGNALGLCTHAKSYSYKKAAMVTAEEVTRVTKGATQTEPPAVYPQQMRTRTTPLTQRMRRLTSQMHPRFLSKDPRTVALSTLLIPDLWGPMAHLATVQAIISSAQRFISKQYHHKETIPGYIGTNKIDNHHADTTCAAGPNWRLIELSGKYCTVSPFSAEYQPKPDVPIAKCATMYTCSTTGNSVILVADQVLWFGSVLHCSLIIPHQIRASGYGVSDEIVGTAPTTWH